MKMIPRVIPVLAALVLAACADDAEPANGPRDPDSARAAQSAAAPQAGDTAAPAVAATPAAPAEPQDTMLTRWTTLQMPSEPWVQEAATPQALLRQVRDVVAAQMEEPDASVLPTRMLSEAADSAVGHLVHPDLADDSIRDVEFRLQMRREGTVWRVTGVDRRERCRRGVAEGGRCA
jgi:hypothetical protein